MSFTPQNIDEIRTHFTNESISQSNDIASEKFAALLDNDDSLASFRKQFNIPTLASLQATTKHSDNQSTQSPNQEVVYLCGNSLGLQPKRAVEYVSQEMSKWAAAGVEGHFNGERPWVSIDEPCLPHIASLVGAKSVDEVGVMNSLSVNLHLLLISFYQPKDKRVKIMIEEAAFCSDHHVVRSQLALHGYNEKDALIQLKVRPGETSLRTEDIVTAINEAGDELALVLLPGIQFYTGQLFDMATITAAGHAVGAFVGWDLAHAAGNVILKLHDWDVDFATWCSYKYLNSGPGAISGLFVHSRLHGHKFPRLSGWWGQTPAVRFKMQSTHVPFEGAQSYQLSNPPVLPTVCLLASLELYSEAGGLEKLRAKSLMLTGYLQVLLEPIMAKYNITVLTPSTLDDRGCQLSLFFPIPIRGLLKRLEKIGVICDGREPNVVRVAPAPLYNSFSDVARFVKHLDEQFPLEQASLASQN